MSVHRLSDNEIALRIVPTMLLGHQPTWPKQSVGIDFEIPSMRFEAWRARLIIVVQEPSRIAICRMPVFEDVETRSGKPPWGSWRTLSRSRRLKRLSRTIWRFLRRKWWRCRNRLAPSPR